jgi:hypothetical protein
MRLAIESLATYKPLAADMTTLLAIGRASIGAWKAKEAAARVRAILRSDLLLICSLSFICSQTLFSTVKCTDGPIQNARVLAPESGCAVSAGSMPSARELP